MCKMNDNLFVCAQASVLDVIGAFFLVHLHLGTIDLTRLGPDLKTTAHFFSSLPDLQQNCIRGGRATTEGDSRYKRIQT